MLWDYLKIKIKEFTISYCISKARSRKNLTKDIEEKLDCIDKYVLNVFIDIQTSKELIQMDTDKMMTYGTFTMDDEKLTLS